MGASQVARRQKACRECHVVGEGELDIKADEIINGTLTKAESETVFEPEPMEGMPGIKEVTAQVAYNAEELFMRFEWAGSGASVSEPSLGENNKADRIAVQLTDTISTFKGYGCYITCHDDQVGMPGDDGGDVTLYGYYTRGADGSVREDGALNGFLAKQQFIDLIEASFVGGEVIAEDMYVLDARHHDDENATATGGYAEGKYSVVISRKLATGDDKDISLEEGADFDIGIAIHDNKNGGRKHYTSFPLSVGLSAPADITATKI
ncbi:MAG: hypothetical protein HUJ31_15390 [Pseudomonadales bacterium]|nr:hypothetical protein [Pseudomonadales bacterium]